MRVKIVCRACGSDAVCMDAVARWNIVTQRWELSGVHDSGATCSGCGDQDAQLTEAPITDSASQPAGESRPYRNLTIMQLQDLADKASDRDSLLAVGGELAHRSVPKARRLAQTISGRLAQLVEA